MLVLREFEFRRANVCQLPDTGTSRSFRTASRPKTNPFFSIGARATSHSAAHNSQEYNPKPIPSMQFKRQEVTADRTTLTRARLPRFHSCVRPIRYKNEAISHPTIATPKCEAPLAKVHRKVKFATLLPGAYERSPRRPRARRFRATRSSRLI